METIGADVSAVVLDAGSWTTKFGYAGDAAPTAHFDSALGEKAGGGLPPAKRKKVEGGSRSLRSRHVLKGVNSRRPQTDIVIPMDLGIVKDWDAMETIWRHCYKILNIPSEEHPLLMSESTWNTKANREKQVELAFEKFKVPAFFAAKDATLACFGVGRGSGLVINSGHQYTSIVPVHEGHCLLGPRFRTKVAGDYLTQSLNFSLKSRQIYVKPECLVQSKKKGGNEAVLLEATGLTDSFMSYATLKVVEDMKKSCLCIRKDPYTGAGSSATSKNYELPDGNVINLEIHQRQSIPEKLFSIRSDKNSNINLDGYTFEGLSQMTRHCLAKVDADARKDVGGSIVLAGGTTALPGFRERLATELERLPHALKPRIVTPQRVVGGHQEEFGIWLGGSILASLGFFQTFWIYPQEYEEEGKNVVHRKCP